jgi:DNA polymerase-3 subunit beta
MFSRLVDANYIEYERFIPKESKTFVTIGRDALEDALERASLVTEDRIQGQVKSVVKFNFEENTLHISAVSINGKFFDEIPIEKTGGDIEIGFACKYLIEILRGTDQPVLKLSLTSSLMSMIIEGENNDEETKFLYLALPMKMRDN